MEFYSPNPQMGLLPSYFGANDQKIMQGLNGRLAVYLEKVRKLEEAKCDLENKISEWSQKQAVGIVDPETEDYGSYFVIIKEEKKKLFDASSQRLTLKLQVEDTRLESEDFLIKYETELSLNRTIQNYIAGLERKQEVANTSIENLQKEYKMLSGELDSIHKEYKEEIKEMENDFNITTEVDSSLGVDLHKTLDKVREEYELLVKKNRYEVEEWYIKLMKHLNSTIVIKDEGISTGKLKIGELRSSLQTLQINLQSQLAEKKNFEDQLVVEERRYGAEIHKLQIDIGELETNIQKHRLKLEQQRREYEQLLNIKIRLEKEIRTYHDLLKTFM
ncbi:keratin, type I cytoskeletal 47 kDa-like [Hyperolius riggenbachi]|uniref:keratin, type I cytoskeletal 47 kDa-like n=1 Tax=Hyperolius riggenbachi TaxID=752182 RepID=UPI0035A26771